MKRQAWFGVFALLGSLADLRGQGVPTMEIERPPMIQVAPTRVVLEGKARGEEIYLHNGSGQPLTYRLRFTEFDMAPDGSLIPLPEGRKDGREASRLIRFSPREVRVEAGSSQVVRLVVRKPSDLPAGEYRSHLVFDMVPEAQPPAPATGGQEGFQVKIQAVYGISIPIILRNGEGKTRTVLEGARWNPDRSAVLFTVKREGDHSIQGEIRASFLPEAGPEKQLSGRTMATLYTGVDRLDLSLPVPPEDLPAGKGRLRLVLKDPATSKTLAEAEFSR